MNNHHRTARSAPFSLVATLAAVRRFFSGGVAPPLAPNVIGREGYQAFTDGLPLSICPYVRPAEVDTWRGGWLDAQVRQEVLAAAAKGRV